MVKCVFLFNGTCARHSLIFFLLTQRERIRAVEREQPDPDERRDGRGEDRAGLDAEGDDGADQDGRVPGQVAEERGPARGVVVQGGADHLDKEEFIELELASSLVRSFLRME